ncbi:MAG: acyltransferase family protein [Erysipelotrichaceae bacterium]|nr:acyltransferase family protein [Erysipelotrichaceae bacterium]
MILIFHVSKETDLLYPLFSYLSNVVVGAFFFISSYGLTKGYLNDPSYIKAYPMKRFLKVGLPYLIMTMVYWSYYLLIGQPYGFGEVLKGIVSYSPIVMYSWFLISIIVHYVYFYILMMVCSDNKKLFSFIAFVLVVFSLAAYLLGFKNPNLPDPLFFAGIVYACNENRAIEEVKKRERAFISVVLTVTVLLTIFLWKGHFKGEFCSSIKKMIFVVWLGVFSGCCSIKGDLFDLLGEISLEIYMCQGLAKMLVRRFLGGPLFIQDMFIFILCLILSFAFHKLFGILRGLLYSGIKKEQL